ncbi:MAG: DUF5662 family protein [Oscillospiraceae bacterium]|nr:DUF5662 family protein [Oscillospiraceae bacterium]
MLHFVKHFCTITKHRHMVIRHCYKAGILWQGLRHDLSKYSPAEFIPGARFYLGDRSPTEAERKEYGYSLAWMHHKGRNKHHFEYWTDYNPTTKRLEAIEMPIKYVKDMFCDRVAAGKIYQGDNYTNDNPINYFLSGSARSAMHPETSKLLESWLRMIQSEGEDKTFAYIKKIKNTHPYSSRP